MQYKTKLLMVEAEPYREGLEDAYDCFAFRTRTKCKCEFNCSEEKSYRDKCKQEARAMPYIITPSGKQYILSTDIIVIGPKSEKYLYRKEIFETIYEKG